MSRQPDNSLAGQVGRVCEQRAHLRSAISAIIAVAKDRPDLLSPALAEQLQAALDYTTEGGR